MPAPIPLPKSFIRKAARIPGESSLCTHPRAPFLPTLPPLRFIRAYVCHRILIPTPSGSFRGPRGSARVGRPAGRIRVAAEVSRRPEDVSCSRTCSDIRADKAEDEAVREIRASRRWEEAGGRKGGGKGRRSLLATRAARRAKSRKWSTSELGRTSRFSRLDLSPPFLFLLIRLSVSFFFFSKE